MYEFKLQFITSAHYRCSIHKCNFSVAHYSTTRFPLMQLFSGTFKGRLLSESHKDSGVNNVSTSLIRA